MTPVSTQPRHAKDNCKVALFTDADVFAGTERHMLELARELRKTGVSVSLAAPFPSVLADRASEEGLDFIPIQKRGLVDTQAIRCVSHLLRTGQVDIIHAHNGRTALSSAIAVSLAGKGKCLATQHFLEPGHVAQTGLKSRFYSTAHRWVSRKTNHFVAISRAVCQEMLDRQEAPPSKISIIPNGILTPDPAALAAPVQVRTELGIGTDVPLIVCAARLEREKNIGSLIAAMGQLAGQFPKAVCVIAGEGSQEQALRHQVRQAGQEKTIKLLGFRTDALSLIQAGDMFVLPSLAEPFGLALLEAMALGKPVIATRAGGPMEIVLHERTGLLVPPADPTRLAQAIQQLLSDPEDARRMGQRGRERFENEYTARRMAKATADLYQRMIQA